MRFITTEKERQKGSSLLSPQFKFIIVRELGRVCTSELGWGSSLRKLGSALEGCYALGLCDLYKCICWPPNHPQCDGVGDEDLEIF